MIIHNLRFFDDSLQRVVVAEFKRTLSPIKEKIFFLKIDYHFHLLSTFPYIIKIVKIAIK